MKYRKDLLLPPPPFARCLRRFYKGLNPTKTTIKNITVNPNKPYSFIPTTLFQINLYGDNQCHTHAVCLLPHSQQWCNPKNHT